MLRLFGFAGIILLYFIFGGIWTPFYSQNYIIYNRYAQLSPFLQLKNGDRNQFLLLSTLLPKKSIVHPISWKENLKEDEYFTRFQYNLRQFYLILFHVVVEFESMDFDLTVRSTGELKIKSISDSFRLKENEQSSILPMFPSVCVSFIERMISDSLNSVSGSSFWELIYQPAVYNTAKLNNLYRICHEHLHDVVGNFSDKRKMMLEEHWEMKFYNSEQDNNEETDKELKCTTHRRMVEFLNKKRRATVNIRQLGTRFLDINEKEDMFQGDTIQIHYKYPFDYSNFLHKVGNLILLLSASDYSQKQSFFHNFPFLASYFRIPIKPLLPIDEIETEYKLLILKCQYAANEVEQELHYISHASES
ncbi:hypothetical protein SNEBB_003841 [Seison nebaliae]|nr:hypothetical protein SNEBB_003841 [Seison nebaliae]